MLECREEMGERRWDLIPTVNDHISIKQCLEFQETITQCSMIRAASTRLPSRGVSHTMIFIQPPQYLRAHWLFAIAVGDSTHDALVPIRAPVLPRPLQHV